MDERQSSLRLSTLPGRVKTSETKGQHLSCEMTSMETVHLPQIIYRDKYQKGFALKVRDRLKKKKTDAE